jgi:hypothetical protein
MILIPIGKYFLRSDPDNFIIATLRNPTNASAKDQYSEYDNLGYYPKLEDAMWALCRKIVKEEEIDNIKQLITVYNNIKSEVKNGVSNAMLNTITELEKEVQALKEQLRDIKQI